MGACRGGEASSMRNKVCLLLFLFVFALGSLYAEENVPEKNVMIASYQFTITGKTDEQAVRRAIIPDGDELFASEEELVAALEAKKQKLVNFRVFSSVEYDYTNTNASKGISFYQVHFTIAPPASILPFPYGKYDSNYGLRIGMKLYDKNLFGQLANLYIVAHATQQDSTFKKGSYYGEVDVNEVPLWGKVKLDMIAKFTYDIKDASKTQFKFNLNTRNILLGNKALNLNPWFYISPIDKSSNQSAWGFTEVGNALNLGPFALVLGGFSLYNKTYANFSDGKTMSNAYTLTYLRFHGLKIAKKNFDSRISLETYGDNFGVLKKMIIGETIGVGFNFAKGWLTWYNELSQYNTLAPSNPLMYGLSFQWGSTLSHSGINWVGDFRKGVSLKLHSEVEWFPKKTYEGRPISLNGWRDWYYIEAMATWFPFVSSWFNPSFRLAGRQTDKTTYFLPGATDETIGEYIRGVRDDNSLLPQTTTFSQTTAFTLNCNFTMKFINLGSFARTYVNPFMDFLLINEAGDPSAMHFLSTIGFEGIGILNKFPAYPVRVSLGFNLNDIIDKIKGTSTHAVEYELFIGMYFFF